MRKDSEQKVKISTFELSTEYGTRRRKVVNTLARAAENGKSSGRKSAGSVGRNGTRRAEFVRRDLTNVHAFAAVAKIRVCGETKRMTSSGSSAVRETAECDLVQVH